jgi:two-component system, OmpR family, sensor histidine kinase VicK
MESISQLRPERTTARNLADFFGNAPIALHWLTADGTILIANQAELDLLGYKAEEYIGQNIMDFHADKFLAKEMFVRLKRGETLKNFPSVLRCKDGSLKHVLIDSNVFWEDGKFKHTRCFTRDVSELIRTQESLLKTHQLLKATENFNQTILDSSEDGMMVLDLETKIQFVNKKTLDYLGLQDSKSIVGTSWIAFCDPELRPQARQAFQMALGGKSGEFTASFSLPGKGMTWWTVVATPVYELGEIKKILIVGRDVTKQELALKTRDEFLSVASHELKTPITTIKFQIQMFEREARSGTGDSLSSPRVVRKLSMMNNQIRRLTSLIDDLLDISRLQNRKMTFEFGRTELVSLLRDLSQRFQEEAKERGLTIFVQANYSVIGYWDKMRMEQVFANLITNAIKYGISPETTNKSIEISVVNCDDRARIIVQDYGLGISECDQQRIFSPFERVSSCQSVGGLGLGLYITKEIVEAHSGKIWIESQLGQGSRFIVELPKTPPKKGTSK